MTAPSPPPRVMMSCGGQRHMAEVILQSPDRKSLAVRFEAIIFGYLGMIPLLWNDARACYIDIFFGNEVTIEWPASEIMTVIDACKKGDASNG